MAIERLVIFVIATIALSIGLPSVRTEFNSKLLEGNEAESDLHPYAVSVRVNKAHICGGTIIGEYHVLTAAHCLMKFGEDVPVSSVAVRLGSNNQFGGGSIIFASAVEKHPDFHGLKNNLAIIITKSALMLPSSRTILPFATEGIEEPLPGDKVEVTGWSNQAGGSAMFKLRLSIFIIATEEECRDAYPEMGDNDICLSHPLNEGSCHGDGGNGAIFEGRLVAITNFVVGACGTHYPDVFTRIVNYSQWISDILQKDVNEINK